MRPGERTPPAARERLGMTGEGPAGQPAVEPPRMLLVFDHAGTDDSLRPIEVAAILTCIEEVFLVTLLRDAPPPDHRGRDWAWDYDAQSLNIRLTRLELGSSLRVLVTIPWHVYTVPFSAFAYGLAHVFGAPARAATLFNSAREDFWSTRLAGEQPKPEWLEWQGWLEVKYEEVQPVPFRLTEVDVVLTLPPEHDAPDE
jgi:hypothetical protein